MISSYIAKNTTCKLVANCPFYWLVATCLQVEKKKLSVSSDFEQICCSFLFADLLEPTSFDNQLATGLLTTMMLSERTDQEMVEGFVFTYVAPSITK